MTVEDQARVQEWMLLIDKRLSDIESRLKIMEAHTRVDFFQPINQLMEDVLNTKPEKKPHAEDR